MDEILVVHPSHGLAACVQVATLTELNHVVNMLTHGLGANEGGLDPTVADDLGGEGAEEGLALIGRLAELGHSLAVTHHVHITTASAGAVGRLGNGRSSKGAGADACAVRNATDKSRRKVKSTCKGESVHVVY